VRLLAVSLVGVVLFFWPFIGADVPADSVAISAMLAAVVLLGLTEVATRRLDSGRLALLAALAAMDAVFRLAMVNGIGGFSPIFFLVLVAGYELGASYGFLVGSYALLVSALVTGGIGPWLPYEAFAVGWVGSAAGVAGSMVRRVRPARQSWWPGRLDLAALAGVAIVTGFAYGALTDIWGWVAFYRGVGDFGWLPGMSPAESIARFGRYYLATSLVWDSFRAFGNALAILALGTPVLAALGRLRERGGFVVAD
jgi:energy-coupling factor transport system substrate-specific component